MVVVVIQGGVVVEVDIQGGVVVVDRGSSCQYVAANPAVRHRVHGPRRVQRRRLSESDIRVEIRRQRTDGGDCG